MSLIKTLSGQNIGEVSAYQSCKQFLGYVGMKINQAPVVQKLDSTIHWISIRENKLLHYPLDRDLSNR